METDKAPESHGRGGGRWGRELIEGLEGGHSLRKVVLMKSSGLARRLH